MMSEQQIAHYRIGSRLGEGNMGVVFRATDTKLGRQVAIKIIREPFTQDAERMARFGREARVLALLNHPNIGAIYGVEESALVMELVEGPTLAERIARSAIPREEALRAAFQIADALEAAHAAGIIHRDLKPSNIKFTLDGDVKLLDFGLAKAVSPIRASTDTATQSTLTIAGSTAGLLIGTPAYMSPEQALGRTDIDKRADIWAFGAVLWETLTGRRLFEGATVTDTIAKVLREEIDFDELPAAMPPAIRDLLRRCLDRDVRNRLRDIGEARIRLQACLSNPNGDSLWDSTAGPRARDMRRNFSPIPLALAAIALAALGFAIHAWFFTPSSVDLTSHRYTPVSLGISATGGFPDPAWSPDGKSVAYVDVDQAGRKQLFLQNLGSPNASQLTQQAGSPRYPVFSPDGRRIYYLGQSDTPREAWSVSTAGGTPQRLNPALGGGSFLDGLAVSRDGASLVFVATEAHLQMPMSLWISSPPGAAPRKYAGAPTTEKQPYARARLKFSPDGSELLAMLFEKGKYQLWLLPWPPDQKRVRRVLPQFRNSSFMSSADWMPDGRHLVLSDTDSGALSGRLWIADIQTGSLSPLSTAHAQYAEPAVSLHDGKVLVAQVGGREDAVEIPLDGSAWRNLVATSRREAYPAWAPAAAQFAYVTDRRGDEEIWLADQQGGWHRPVVMQNDLPSGPKYRFLAPVWSPDGTRIAYAAADRVWSSPVAGGPATPVSPAGVVGRNPTWSPDGEWIAFSELVQNSYYLSRQKVGSDAPPARIREVGVPFRPAWSPDGRWLTIPLQKGFGVISPDGREEKLIYSGVPGLGGACGWSRDGATLYLAYVRGRDLILSRFDIRTGTEHQIVNLGSARFSYFALASALLSEAPDRKSVAGSFWRPEADLWMIEGVKPPPGFWRRLFGLGP